MKAARLIKYSTPYEVQEIDIPALQTNDLLVKVGAAGYCHTDYQTTVWGGIRKARIPPSSKVGVIGIGGLGALAVQFLKAFGHQVVAIDKRQEGLDLSTELPLKADLVVHRDSETAVQEVMRWTENKGLAAVVICTDDVPVHEWGLKLLAAHATCVVLGLPTEALKFNAFDLVFKELSIVGSLVSTVEEAREMMDVVDRFGIQSLVTLLGLGDAPQLPARYMDPHLKGRLVVAL